MWQHEVKRITGLGRYSLKETIKENIKFIKYSAKQTMYYVQIFRSEMASAKMSSVMVFVLLIDFIKPKEDFLICTEVNYFFINLTVVL